MKWKKYLARFMLALFLSISVQTSVAVVAQNNDIQFENTCSPQEIDKINEDISLLESVLEVLEDYPGLISNDELRTIKSEINTTKTYLDYNDCGSARSAIDNAKNYIIYLLTRVFREVSGEFNQIQEELSNASNLCPADYSAELSNASTPLNQADMILLTLTPDNIKPDNVRIVLENLEDAKLILDGLKEKVNTCVKIAKLIKEANYSLQQNKDFFRTNLTQIQNFIEEAKELLGKENFTGSNETVNKALGIMREIVLNKEGEIEGTLEEAKGLLENYPDCHDKIKFNSIGAYLENANKASNITEAIKELKLANETIKNGLKSASECMLAKLEPYKKIVEINTKTYGECFNVEEYEKLKESGNYLKSIKYAVQLLESNPKSCIIEAMKERYDSLTDEYTSLSREINGLNELKVKLKENWTQTNEKLKNLNKPPLVIWKGGEVEEKLMKANETLINATSLLKDINVQELQLDLDQIQKLINELDGIVTQAENAKTLDELSNIVKDFEKTASQVESKETTLAGDIKTAKENLENAKSNIETAAGYISDIESIYKTNKILLFILGILLVVALGFAGYKGYNIYMEQKRKGEAEEAVRMMREILEDTRRKLGRLDLLTDEGVQIHLNRMYKLVRSAEGAFRGGQYSLCIRLKDRFLEEYEALHSWIAPYEATLKVNLSDHVAAKTYIGRRENNEDAYIAEKVGGNILLAVADGMGGHLGGEVASKKAIEILKETLERNKLENPETVFREAIKKANETIYRMGHDPSHPEWFNMGTTLTAAIIRGDQATVANVGDSRTYLIRNGKVVWRTKDHSLVQELIDKGEITEEEAKRHPQKNVITKALGIEPTIEINPGDIKTINLKKGDYLLLCSDGLSDVLDDREIARTVAVAPSLEDAVKILIEKAYGYGSNDNITVVLYRH